MSHFVLSRSRLGLLLVLPMLLGCGTTGTTEPDNLPPQSEIVEPAEPSGTLTAADGAPVTFRWECIDPEEQDGLPGGLAAIRIQLDDEDPIQFECPPDEGEWWFSSSAEVGSAHHISSSNDPTGGNRAHSFRVWAQDIEGCWESPTDRAVYVFWYNHSPSSEILSPLEGETIGSSFTVTWEGSDVDGEVAEYQYILDPELNDWNLTDATSASYSDVRSGEHEFRLRAKDNGCCWEETFNVVTFRVD